MEARRVIRPAGKALIGVVVALLVLVGAALLVRDYLGDRLAPDPETIATASLQGLREQNRLSAFAARFVAVVTSQQSRLGLTARKTMIMPGMVRYEVDLSRLEQDDVRWDAATSTLSVTLPPVEISGPEVDLAAIREYDGGGLLMKLTDAESALDAANRRRGQQELLAQARQPVAMRLAEDATRRAIESSFAMPLRAAGLDARVEVRFAHDARRSSERVDRSRTVEEVLGDKEGQ